MNGSTWPFVEFASRLLAPEEREAVLGDLQEADESAFRALGDVLGLFLRRHGVLLSRWRPWFAAFGVAFPACYLLMGVSASVICTFLRLTDPAIWHWWWPTGHEGVLLWLCHIFLLLIWSWTAGFVVGSLSRSAVWVSGALCLAPLLRAGFPIEPLPRLCLFLFILPAVVGAYHGLRRVRLDPMLAFALAFTATALTTFAWSSGALWIYNWALIWPAWYLAFTALRHSPIVQPA